VGDSIAVIPPLTGNGMSLAVESAFLAAPVLREYSTGKIDWPQALARHSQECKKRFGSRLYFSSILQKAVLDEARAKVLLSCLKAVPSFLHILFRLTR
jgi:2-polyprenyl-6-methoxyphenol hydroxylase-like FAD-dependent oxidoreductase